MNSYIKKQDFMHAAVKSAACSQEEREGS